MEAMEAILNRRSIRKFKDEKIKKEELEQILKAGSYAASARGLQSAIMIAVEDEETLETLRRLNCTSIGREYTADNFYGAKTVVVVLADRNNPNRVYDGSLVMGNLMNAAEALGIGSCWIHRAKETFETEEGKEILRKLGIEGEYEGIGNCILGYPDQQPVAKERKENYIYHI